MKKFVLIIIGLAIGIVIMGQSIDDLLKIADNISSINYVRDISSFSGITSFGLSGIAGGSAINSGMSYSATGIVSIGIYKNLNLNIGISSNNALFASLIFDPTLYQKSEEKAFASYQNERLNLKMDVINYFFDAMKMNTMINYQTGKSTSLQNLANVDLMRSQYTYDLRMLGALLNITVDKLSFPPLSVPQIPSNFTPYNKYTLQSQNTDLYFTLNGSIEQNQSANFSISLNYAWNKPSNSVSQNLENIKKQKYFDDIHILASYVKMYDAQINSLLQSYSTIYGNYLAGKASAKDVNSISDKINQYGYERDLLCIELLREYYLYEVMN
ncbi:hypothetical protein [Athalassotoga saccharophila]|uniref:hypothetical protein n=1 Tax=Athalassotoga saccharophila TaxID=1441386 RepID=UPI00137A02DA|nr:hypothetical protein [Athalassotoga saccharophila]BBJ28601.1 hypothetical protein ATHSA_1520 [Athalassotoga saccharophila]